MSRRLGANDNTVELDAIRAEKRVCGIPRSHALRGNARLDALRRIAARASVRRRPCVIVSVRDAERPNVH